MRRTLIGLVVVVGLAGIAVLIALGIGGDRLVFIFAVIGAAISTVGSFVVRWIRSSRESVGVWMGDDELIELKKKPTRRELEQILEAVAEAQPDGSHDAALLDTPTDTDETNHTHGG